MNKIRLVVASLLLGAATGFAQKPFNASGTGNPIIPGYFADPTVKKFGDTYYMYATTDGSGAGFGPAQVWTSKDCELDVNAHELAGQSLDMGSRCDAAYGWELLLFLLSALYDSLRGQ